MLSMDSVSRVSLVTKCNNSKRRETFIRFGFFPNLKGKLSQRDRTDGQYVITTYEVLYLILHLRLPVSKTSQTSPLSGQFFPECPETPPSAVYKF